MKPIPLMRAAGVAHAAVLLRDFGAPVTKLLERARLPVRFSDPECLIPIPAMHGFLESAARSQGIANLGFQLGQIMDLEQVGTFGRLILQAPTLHAALRTGEALAPAYSAFERIRLLQNAERAELQLDFTVRLDPHPQLEQFRVITLVKLLRRGGGTSWRPDEIHVKAPRNAADFSDLEALAVRGVRYGRSATALSFAPSVLARTLPVVAPSRLAPQLDVWTASGPARDLSGSVRQFLQTVIPSGGHAPVAATAAASGMSARTLQRRLGEAGASYSQLVARARFDVAARLLRDEDVRLIDIAMDLGYSDHAHFTRAFKHWTGMTPREFRRMHMHAGHVTESATQHGSGRDADPIAGLRSVLAAIG